MKKIFALIISFFVLFIWSISFASAETSYTYYWGQGCPHCANVADYMDAVDGWNKMNVDKREIYFEKENAAKFTADIERLGLDSAKVWVPFLIVNTDWVETTFSWDTPIIDHFLPILWEAPENNKKTIVFIILGLLAVLIPLFIIKNSK